jgi:hypothetical protein
MSSGDMMYIQHFMMINSGIQVIFKGITSISRETSVLVLMMEGIYEVFYCIGLKWHDIHTRFHDDQFSHSSNFTAFTSTFRKAAILVLWWEGFMKYAAEMASGSMIYVPSFMKLNRGVKNYYGGYTYRHTRADSKLIS